MSKDKLMVYLTVEVGVKFYELLENDDELPVYEYLSEAQKVIDSVLQRSEPSIKDMSLMITKVFQESINHTYPEDTFIDVAKFIQQRLRHFKKHALI